MKNTEFPHKFWRPFLDCMPQLFFRPQYVWFPVHLKGHLIPLCYETLVVNWQNWLFTLFHQSRSVLSPNPNRTLANIFQWNFNQNITIFIKENALENVVCEMAGILSRSQCVFKASLLYTWPWLTKVKIFLGYDDIADDNFRIISLTEMYELFENSKSTLALGFIDYPQLLVDIISCHRKRRHTGIRRSSTVHRYQKQLCFVVKCCRSINPYSSRLLH